MLSKTSRALQAQKEALKLIGDQVERLQTAQDASEASLRAVRLEWEDTYDKILRLYQRLNKRDRDEAKEDPEPLEDTSQLSAFRNEILARRNVRRSG